MRAPARAQDLILAHRVRGYRAGDLGRRYGQLAIEEAFFLNYGFLPRATLAQLYPRAAPCDWDDDLRSRAAEIHAFVRENGQTRAKDVQAKFDHGSIKRWGGALNVSGLLLDGLHYRGLIRVVRRDAGTRVYQAIERPAADDSPEVRLERARALLDVVVNLYAPVPAPSLRYMTSLLRKGVPDLGDELQQLHEEATTRYAHAEVDRLLWYWPVGENPRSTRYRIDDKLRFLAPFDPVVWDRRRFRLFWGWEYKFEAYVPARNRRMGHYAMPMLWREDMIGWANLKLAKGRLQHRLGFVGSRPRGRSFNRALDAALEGMRKFLRPNS